MKIIHVVGLSNSGKTTFIKDLIPEIKKRGTVAVVKHLGDHDFQLEAGKDTTGFFEAGADLSIGIDSHKSVIAIHKNNLDEILFLLNRMKTDFAIIEGFKTRPFPKIGIGDLEGKSCILRNPEIWEVISALEKFEDYYTKKAD